MKKRSYFRQSVTQKAKLKLPDSEDLSCEITNFCQAGLFLRLTVADCKSESLQKSNRAEIVFSSPATEKTFRLEGTLGHICADGAGFVFSHAPSFAALHALHCQALRKKAFPKEGGGNDRDLIFALHGNSLRALENALKPLLDPLAGHIEAELAEGNGPLGYVDENLQPLETADLRSSPARRVVEDFYAHAMEQAESFVVADLCLYPEAGAIYSMSASQRLIFDDWMNLIEKVKNLESRYEETLGIIESRFSHLAQREINARNNPFGPHVLCHCFHYSLRELGLNNFRRNRIYEGFAGLLGAQLTGLYEELKSITDPLRVFESGPHKNICPPPMPSDPVGTPTARKNRPASAPPRPTTESAPYPPQPDAFAAFVLLSRYADSQAHRHSLDVTNEFDPVAIIEALKKLQSIGKTRRCDYFNAPSLQAGLTQILAEAGKENALSHPRVRETLQIIGLLLDGILGDTTIPPGIKPYFRKLQIPLLMEAFADPGLLNAHTHPARETLNRLDHLSLATNAQGEIDNAELIRSLDKLMNRISAGVGDGIGIFAETLKPLETLTTPLLRAYATRLQRVVDACEGSQRLEQARRRVEREIDSRIGGKTVPYTIPSLLDTGWRQLLVLTYLRQGADSEEWLRQLTVIDHLLQGPENTSARVNIQELKSFTLERLAGTGAGCSAANVIVEELGELLQCLSGERGRFAHTYVPPAAAQEEETAPNGRLQGFSVGDWLKFASGSGACWIPLRLTWIGQYPARYVFANRRGVKSLDLDAARFIQILDEGRASRIESLDELPLTERAAKSILHTLREHLR